jgi:hypothetical protein
VPANIVAQFITRALVRGTGAEKFRFFRKVGNFKVDKEFPTLKQALAYRDKMAPAFDKAKAGVFARRGRQVAQAKLKKFGTVAAGRTDRAVQLSADGKLVFSNPATKTRFEKAVRDYYKKIPYQNYDPALSKKLKEKLQKDFGMSAQVAEKARIAQGKLFGHKYQGFPQKQPITKAQQRAAKERVAGSSVIKAFDGDKEINLAHTAGMKIPYSAKHLAYQPAKSQQREALTKAGTGGEAQRDRIYAEMESARDSFNKTGNQSYLNQLESANDKANNLLKEFPGEIVVPRYNRRTNKIDLVGDVKNSLDPGGKFFGDKLIKDFTLEDYVLLDISRNMRKIDEAGKILYGSGKGNLHTSTLNLNSLNKFLDSSLEKFVANPKVSRNYYFKGQEKRLGELDPAESLYNTSKDWNKVRDNIRSSVMTRYVNTMFPDEAVGTVMKDGGRVKKFMGGYLNPEDIEAEIEIAELTDGEIITQKEAIDRIIERFTNNFKEGGLAREKFEVGGPVGGGISGAAVGGGRFSAVGGNKIGNIQAVLAGVAAGIIDIPKGAFSLGASLMDLGLGTSTAAKVENFFDNLTEFDEIAEQRTAGQIARIITNLGIPGSQAWKMGTGLARRAMFSRNAGKYFKASDPKIGPKIDDALNAKGRLYSTLGGAAGIGVADAIFVGDPERVGTLGDAFDFGPTQLRPNDENSAAREVMNRIKFGLDSSLLLGLVGGSGSAIKSMIKRRNELESNNDFIDKILSKIRPRGDKPMEFFRLEREQIGIRAGDVNRAQEISRAVDRHIDGMFPFLKPMYEKGTIKSRTDLMKTLNDTLLSGNTQFTPTGRVAFGKMDDGLVKVATKKMQDLGAKPEAIRGVLNSFDEIRTEWGDMFTALGTRMDEKNYKKFSAAFSKKMNDYLSTTYDVFRNKSLLPFLNFKAGEESVNKLANLFIKTAKEKGENLSVEQARHYVDQVVETATPGGKGLPIREDATAGVFFRGNKFFEDLVDKSILGDVEFNPKVIQLNTLKPEAKQVIDEVLGKIEDPIQTILQGTQKLSLITRRNEFFDELLKSSKAAQDAGGKGFFYTDEADAFAAFGKNIKRIDFDPSKTLEAGVTNPLNGLYAQTGVANALEQTSKNILDMLGSGAFSRVYQNFILYPKATSQLAKTVLSPITHMRNLFSASAFAAANGLLPGFIGPDEIVKNMKSAYSKLQFGRADDPVANKAYRKLLRLGVVNSNVTLGDLSRLLEDVKFGENITAASGVKGLMRQLGKAKRYATDLYTAEDDLWKIYTFATERGRFEKAFKRAGITKSADELDEMAADIVRNNVPNYDYVSDFIKGLRQFPIGNFVSFPAEIMRTSVNIMTRGLKEYNEEAIVNGVKVYPLRNIGLQRLFGFAATTTAIPYALVEGAKAIYDVSGMEMDALRRFVPDWSKNSTIIPVRSDDGDLKYIDFSHANAYDTMIRPVTTLINNIRDGQVEQEAISKSILQGVFEATKELGQPFISEAIWTEAATDIIVRGGRTRDGRRLFTDQTPNGEKAMAIVGHLVDSQLPGSIEQFKRFDLALEGVDVIQSGKFDKYGRQYEFGDELLGVIGMRAVEVNPVNSMKFKIADYTRGISNARREFTTPLLRGGAVTPEQIVDRYQIANNQAYKVQQEIFRDYYAARTLGAKETALDREFKDRVSRVSLAAIKSGRYKPFIPSENIIASFGENARKLGQRNPYLAAKPVIDRIIRQYNNLPLVMENFPILPNPFSVTQPTSPAAGLSTGLPNLNLGLSIPTGTGTTGNTIQKGQVVFGPLDSVFGSS